MSGRPVEAVVSFLKASKFRNLRQFSFVFISLSEVLRRFCKVVFLSIKTKKLCLDNIIQSRNNLSNYYSF